MNRRSFIQSLAAVFSVPTHATLSLQPAAAAIPTAAAVPAKARFWAIYMSGLHGQCPPETLQKMLHISEADAKSYLGRLLADGVIKPNPFLQTAAPHVLNSNGDDLVNGVRERLEAQTQSRATEIPEAASEAAPEEAPGGMPEDIAQGAGHGGDPDAEPRICDVPEGGQEGGQEDGQEDGIDANRAVTD